MSSSPLSFQKSSAVHGLTGLAKQIALPHDHPPQRFPSFPALERTALMGFNAPVSWSLPASAPSRALISRSATYPLWTEVVASPTWYGAVYTCVGTLLNAVAAPISNALYGVLNIENTNANPLIPKVSGPRSAELIYPILGINDTAAPFIYVPSGWKLFIGFSMGAASLSDITCSVEVEEWLSPGETASTISAVAGTALLASPAFGAATDLTSSVGTGKWVRPRFVDLTNFQPAPEDRTSIFFFVTNYTNCSFSPANGNAGRFDVSGTAITQAALLPAAMPNEFSTSVLPWASTRVTAVASLFTNVTQVLNKGGTVLCGRLSPTAVNPFTFAATSLQTLHPAEKAYLPLETGAYSYCPPSTDLADFLDYTAPFAPNRPASAGGSINVPVYRLDNTSLVNAFVFTPTAAVESMAINVDWHLEFRTNSALFQIGLSTLTLEAFHQAQLALVQVGFFFPNSWHKEILSRVIAAAKRIAPAVAGLHPITKAVYRAVKGKGKKSKGDRPPKRNARAPPQSLTIKAKPAQMPTTTAARSGMSGPSRKKGG